MKRESIDQLGSQKQELITHDLNKILALLHAGRELSLPSQLRLPTLKQPTFQRLCSVGDLNQVWRYGGILEEPTDIEVEQGLEAIQSWISKELQ